MGGFLETEVIESRIDSFTHHEQTFNVEGGNRADRTQIQLRL
jgi:hypothetical protein